MAWQLMDVDETDGGFVSPSSHARAAYPSCASCSADLSLVVPVRARQVFMPGGHKASLPLPTDHYSPTPEGGNAYKVGDDHDPEGLFGVVRPLPKAGGAPFTSRPRPRHDRTSQ